MKLFKKIGLFPFKLDNNLFFILILVLIIFTAFLIRILNLTALPVFVDEAIYIRWAQVMKAESTLRFLPLSDGKQPLFMWTIIPFLKVISDPLIAGRLLSVFSGIGTLVGIILLSLKLFKSKKMALLTGVIYALSPFSVFFDRMALVDSMLSMFGIWTFYFFLMSVTSLRLDYAMLAGFSLGGALLTKSPALFFVILLPTLFLLGDIKRTDRISKKRILRMAGYLFTTMAIGYGMFNILRLGPNFHMLNSRNFDYVYPYSHILESPLNPLIPHMNDILDWFIKLGPFPLLLLFLGGVYWGIKNRRKEVIVILIWLILPIFIQAEYAKVFTARYILFSIPFLFLLVPLSFEPKDKRIKLVNKFILALFICFSVFQNFWFIFNPEKAVLPKGERSGYLEQWTAGTGIKEVADYLIKEQENNPGEKIVVGTEGFFGTLPDGLQIYLNDYPDITVVGLGVNFLEIPEELVNSVNSGTKTYFVVNNTRMSIQNVGNIGVINIFSKAASYNKQTEKLLFYRVY